VTVIRGAIAMAAPPQQKKPALRIAGIAPCGLNWRIATASNGERL
jgi:hypothetical protein